MLGLFIQKPRALARFVEVSSLSVLAYKKFESRRGVYALRVSVCFVLCTALHSRGLWRVRKLSGSDFSDDFSDFDDCRRRSYPTIYGERNRHNEYSRDLECCRRYLQRDDLYNRSLHRARDLTEPIAGDRNRYLAGRFVQIRFRHGDGSIRCQRADSPASGDSTG